MGSDESADEAVEFGELVNSEDCPDRANCVNSTERHGPDDGVDDSAYLGVLVDRADGTDKLNNGFGRDDGGTQQDRTIGNASGPSEG